MSVGKFTRERRSGSRMRAPILICLCMIVLSSCGTEPSSSVPGPTAGRFTAPPPAKPTTPPDPDGEQLYRGVGLVIDLPKKRPPEVCLGSVNDSDPPQCEGNSGIPLVGWDWNQVPPEDGDRSYPWGVYGDYELTGHYDGDRFTVVDAAPFKAQPSSDEDEESDDTPCTEPEGGWESTDPERTTERDKLLTVKAAEREPDSSGAWIDGGILNLAFTGDLDEHETEVRETWGGPLCLSQYRNSHRRLSAIQSGPRDVVERFNLDALWTDLDVIENTVLIGVVIIDPVTLAEIDRHYGAGTVTIHARLHPVES
jgi:hypothetical protein